MRRIKDIREDYNLVTEKEQTDISKLTALVRAGLFDAKKIGIVKRALEKNPAEMTLAERKILIELLDSLMSEVLHSQQVYSKVKQNVMGNKEKMNEATKDSYLTKFDPRATKYPSESDIPVVLILKRKAIRVYPDNQKVALYYAQAIDKYVSIPYGNINTAINEDKKDKDDGIENVPINTMFGDPEKEKKAKEYIDKSLPLSSRAGLKTGLWLRKKFGKRVAASSEVSSGETTSKTEPTTSKQPEKKATPERVIPTKKFRKRKTAGTGEQPTGDFKFAEPASKTKTLSYSSTVAPARKLTPLEKSSGKIADKKQLPRKRLGFDPKVPGTGAQPEVGKTKIKAALQKKLSESRVQLKEKRILKEYSKGEAAWDVATALPVVGNVLSAGEAAYKAAKGDYAGAGLAAASAIPGAGNAAKVAKIGYKGTSALVKGTAKKRAEKEVAKDVKKNEPEVPTTKPSEKPKGKPDKTPDTEPAEVLKPKTEPKPETEVKPKTDTKAKPETKPDAKPSLGKRIVDKTKRIGGKVLGAAGAVAGALAGAAGEETKQKKFTEPKRAFTLGTKISSAKEFDTEVSRNRKRESQYDKSLVSEDVMTQLYTIKESHSEGYININNNTVAINKIVVEKVIGVFESLNKENQKKVNAMLNESVDSFKKIINFAVRQ